MSAEGIRATWTDERIDDFRNEVSGRFDGVDRRLERIDERFDRIDERFDALYRAIVTLGGGIIAAIIVSAGGIIATQI